MLSSLLHTQASSDCGVRPLAALCPPALRSQGRSAGLQGAPSSHHPLSPRLCTPVPSPRAPPGSLVPGLLELGTLVLPPRELPASSGQALARSELHLLPLRSCLTRRGARLQGSRDAPVEKIRRQEAMSPSELWPESSSHRGRARKSKVPGLGGELGSTALARLGLTWHAPLHVPSLSFPVALFWFSRTQTGCVNTKWGWTHGPLRHLRACR